MITFKKVNIIFILSLVAFILSIWINDISFYWLFIPGLFWFIFTTIGSFHIEWNYFLQAKHKNYDIKDNVIALSFDDGPNHEFTPKVLELLKQYHAKATFFCIGKNVKESPEILKQIIAEGHVVGNHSFNHNNAYGFLTPKQMILDIEKSRSIVEQTVQLKMKLFRPPFGVTTPYMKKAIKKLNLHTLGWSVRSYDTVAKNPEKVFEKITKNLKRGDVVLLHDTSELSISVLEKLLVHLMRNNMNVVTLDKLFNIKAYDV